MHKIINLPFSLLLFLTACASPLNGRSVSPYQLAAFSQNYVSVKVYLERNSPQKTYILATFTPESGYHLYRKDIPREGVYGEGRPTLLELNPGSQMHSIGELTASAEAKSQIWGQMPCWSPGRAGYIAPAGEPAAGCRLAR